MTEQAQGGGQLTQEQLDRIAKNREEALKRLQARNERLSLEVHEKSTESSGTDVTISRKRHALAANPSSWTRSSNVPEMTEQAQGGRQLTQEQLDRIAKNREKALKRFQARNDRLSLEARNCSRIKNVVEVDNWTMVHVFKYLNYCQLAKSNLVSKRFRDVISANRDRLARLLVDNISMMSCYGDTPTEIMLYNEDLSPEEYNDATTKDHIFRRNIYRPYNEKSAFSAVAKLSDEKWPLFEHFIRILTDPFIIIKRIELTSQNDVLNALAKAVTTENRLQTNVLIFNTDSSIQKFMNWINDYVCCDTFVIDADQRFHFSECYDEDGNYHSIDNSDIYRNYNKEFLELFDFCVTGARCASVFTINYYDFSRVVASLIQKFMVLKSSDECQFFQSIESSSALTKRYVAYDLKDEFAEFLVEEEEFEDDEYIKLAFEFRNTDIKKKLELTAEIYDNTSYYDSGAYPYADHRESSFNLAVKDLQ
ncbi:hypothetical protein DdX_07098 [Ditylenchus destructor]|uniref:F-box domain-containing protein n=1 Tax=Ditylenchus destructor TaxID=166010 RepID=A0AAD4N763_9BILA|nr:hypothetical protein DdX_07098 [Ditylenchus destructor]